MFTERREHDTVYRRHEGGPTVAYVYFSKRHWYAVDEDGEDLPGSWRHETREGAEALAQRIAARITA